MTRRRFWYLRRKSRTVASEVDEELSLHLELRVQELQSQGMAAGEARREALRQFGDLERTRQYCRRQDEQKESEMQRSLLFQDFAQDVRICLRSLLRAPVLTLTIVATVGLGIGATTAIFSAVSAALLRPLPYAEPENLVRIYTDSPPFKFRFSVVDYQAFTEQQRRFERHATYTDRAVSFINGDTAELLRTRVVSWGFFSVLGIQPAIGRDFNEQDGKPGTPQVAIAGYTFWRERLGGRADAVGKPVRLDGADYTLIGVMPPASGPLDRRFDLFLIQQFTPPQRKGPFFYSVIARLPPGADRGAGDERASCDQPRAVPDLEGVVSGRQVDVEHGGPEDQPGWQRRHAGRTRAGRRRPGVADRVRECLEPADRAPDQPPAGACRPRRTRRHARTRLALPAGRERGACGRRGGAWRGGGVGRHAVVAGTGRHVFSAHAGDPLRCAASIWLMAGLAISSALIFGLVPALHATGGSVDASLRSGRTVAGGAGVRRLRRSLVAAQFAIATPLLIVAALLITSLERLRQVDLGFEAAQLLTGSIRLPGALYRDDARVNAFWDELRRRAEALPGVAAVAFSDGHAPQHRRPTQQFRSRAVPDAVRRVAARDALGGGDARVCAHARLDARRRPFARRARSRAQRGGGGAVVGDGRSRVGPAVLSQRKRRRQAVA